MVGENDCIAYTLFIDLILIQSQYFSLQLCSSEPPMPQLRLGMDIFKLVVRYLLVKEGVLAPGRPALLAHA